MNLVETFQQWLGNEYVSQEESIRKEKATDLYALRLFQKHVGWTPTLPQMVLKPGNAEEIARILKLCHEQKVPVICYGGGSGVLGGTEVRDTQVVVIDMERLNGNIQIDEENLLVTCDGGVYIKDLEKILNDKGYMLGHYPQSFDLAQMGGLVATRSIGQFSTGYGGIEDLLMGLKAVLPTGEEISIKSNPRRAVGPDLRHMFLGSEGAMGIITQVTVKIFPMPKERWMEAYRVKSIREGLSLIEKVMKTGIKPAVVRLHDWLECEKPYGAFMEEDECLVLFLSQGEKEMVAAEKAIIQRIAKEKEALCAGEKPVEIWLSHRNDAADEYEKYGPMGFLVDTIEISAHWKDIADIYEDVVETVYYEVPEIMFFSGHSSHSYMNGTNIYFQIGAVPGQSAEEAKAVYDKIWGLVLEKTLAHHGSIGHHHGVGKHRAPWMEKEHGSSFVLMKKLKEALDPNGIMNPGSLMIKEG